MLVVILAPMVLRWSELKFWGVGFRGQGTVWSRIGFGGFGVVLAVTECLELRVQGSSGKE